MRRTAAWIPFVCTHNGQDGEGTDGGVCLGDTSRSLEVDQVGVLLELRVGKEQRAATSDNRSQWCRVKHMPTSEAAITAAGYGSQLGAPISSAVPSHCARRTEP